jgi:argininosuccinate lyase
MLAAASGGFIGATDCADYLVGKGMPFRDAHTVAGKLVAYCVANGKTLETLDAVEYARFSSLFGEDIYAAIDLKSCVEQRNVPGGPASVQVRSQIQNVREFLRDGRTMGVTPGTATNTGDGVGN